MNTPVLDLSVIILTFNEELHIKRCLDNVTTIAKDIFIIDSYSSDKRLKLLQNIQMSIYYKTNGKTTMPNNLIGD